MTNPNRLVQADTLVNQATMTGALAASDFSPGTVVAGRFRIERLLGMGGMGLVYQAHDTELDIDVALKLLRPELASRRDAFERFRQELLLARQVSSPHVVRIHDLVKHENAWLISMDYVPGQSLERLLDQRGPLPVEEAITMTRQLALGLSAAHRSGVVHRDLKPANVLVNEQGEACITDFGVARSAGTTGITDSGVIIGTPAYLSPEQARAEPLDGRSDLYALGLILFEMLTGTLPFRGGTPAEMMVQRIVRDPPSVATIKPELPAFAVRLCAHLLELKPAHRFQSAEEVIAAIDSRRVPGLVRSRRGRLALTAAVLLSLAAALVLYQWRSGLPAGATSAAATSTLNLDLVTLPLQVAGSDEADLPLGAGIDSLLTERLAEDPDFNSASRLQVRRVLAELGFDAEAAQRQRSRVFEVTGAAQILDGQMQRSDDGQIRITLALWKPGLAQAQWTRSASAAKPTDLPAALLQLQQGLQGELGAVAANRPWPAPEVLTAIGRLESTAPAEGDVDALAQLAQSSASSELWWALLQSLDGVGRAAEATAVARRASEATESAADSAGRRAHAYAQLLLGNFELAREELQVLITAAPGDPALTLLKARAQAELGDFQAAIAELTELTADDQRDIHAWYLLGKYSIQSGDAKRAVDDYLVRAQVLANRLDDVRMQANVGNALGLGYRLLGQLAAAAERFESSFRIRQAIGDARGQAASLRNLSTVRSIQGDYAAAAGALSLARSLVEPLGDPVAMADLVNDVGVLAEEQGDYRGALDAYRDALRLRQAQGNLREIGQSQINVGFAYYQLGEFDNAQTYWQQAMASYQQADDRIGMVHARESLALAETASGAWEQARGSFDHILVESESLQMAEERSIAQAGLAELDRLEGRMVSALDNAGKAMMAFRQREDARGISEMTLLQAAVFCDLDDWAQAASTLATLSPEDAASGEQASLYDWRRGEIALGQGQPDLALGAADAAIASASEQRNLGNELAARLLRTRALMSLKRTPEALQELNTVRKGRARYASVPFRLLLAETELEVDIASKTATYQEARALLARLPDYGRAFRIHALAAQEPSATSSDQPLKDARDSLARLQQQTPPEQQASLERLARSLGLGDGAP
ncbi:MAG: protein kinase [Lysobacterales bacterium]